MKCVSWRSWLGWACIQSPLRQSGIRILMYFSRFFSSSELKNVCPAAEQTPYDLLLIPIRFPVRPTKLSISTIRLWIVDLPDDFYKYNKLFIITIVNCLHTNFPNDFRDRFTAHLPFIIEII